MTLEFDRLNISSSTILKHDVSVEGVSGVVLSDDPCQFWGQYIQIFPSLIYDEDAHFQSNMPWQFGNNLVFL